uniref:Noggin n=1 Tax=Latimeria chalumnae TaxID=7897 RepID=H2ZVL9_LATCH
AGEKKKPKPAGVLSSESDVGLIRAKASSPIRPYSLSLVRDDYYYSPKPRHLKSAKLFRLLGSSFDPFWMSVERPNARNASQYHRKLEMEAQSLDLRGLLPEPMPANTSEAVVTRFRNWLVAQATCRLTHSWVDLGSVFWPRWVRHTDCEDSGPTCSWPPGMTCQHAQLTHIKLLAWHCWLKADLGGIRRPAQQCTWKQVPYPVVTACKCSC